MGAQLQCSQQSLLFLLFLTLPPSAGQQTPLLNLAVEVTLGNDGPQLSRIAPRDASNLLLAQKAHSSSSSSVFDL